MKRLTRKKADLLKPLTATVSDHTRRRLEAIAKAENRNLSQVVRIAFDEYLTRRESTA